MNRLTRLIRGQGSNDAQWDAIDRTHLDDILEALGRIEARLLESKRGRLHDHEFRVFSMAGEDGIVQHLARSVHVPRLNFVEFGVEDYREANTRFLLVNNHWSGLVIDGDQANVDRIRRDRVSFTDDLRAVAAFVTRENVNQILAEHGQAGDLGLLSIDVDGNDYWIFDAVDVVTPAIAIVEYNHRFGPDRAVTIPYDPQFRRTQSDASWLFSGASLRAIVGAADRKGMAFVGCNSFGNNAFFVRSDLVPDWMPVYSAAEGFVRGRFRESLKIGGEMVAIGAEEETRLLAGVDLVDLD